MDESATHVPASVTVAMASGSVVLRSRTRPLRSTLYLPEVFSSPDKCHHKVRVAASKLTPDRADLRYRQRPRHIRGCLRCLDTSPGAARGTPIWPPEAEGHLRCPGCRPGSLPCS